MIGGKPDSVLPVQVDFKYGVFLSMVYNFASHFFCVSIKQER